MIELLVVAGLLAIATGLVILRIDRWLPRWRLRSVAGELVETIRATRHAAVAEGRAYLIDYDFGEERCEARVEDTTRPGLRRSLRFPTGIDLVAIDAGDENSRGLEELTVRFDPSGIVKGHRIILKDEGGRQVILTVNALLNQVEFIDD